MSDMQVQFIDPASGTVATARDFSTSGATVNADCGAQIAGPFGQNAAVRTVHAGLRAAFDANYSRLAVTVPGDNQGSDVGYVAAAGGSIVDITRLQPSGGAFGPAPADTLPSFRPGTDELWFDHGGKVVSVAAGGAQTSQTAHPDLHVESGTETSGGDSLGVDATGHWNTPDFVPVNSTGTRWVGYLQNEPTLASLHCDCKDDGYGIYPPGGIDWGNFDVKPPLQLYAFPSNGRGDGCTAWAWITMQSWVCFDGTTIGVATAQPSNHMLSVTYPIPQTSGRINYDPVLSPDHRTIAFQSCRAGACAIYTVPVAGSATPTKVTDTTGGALIEWR